MSVELKPDDPRRYEGLTQTHFVVPSGKTLCPACNGHGRWINHYEKDGHAFREECRVWNRELKRFVACSGPHHRITCCFQCNGWGVVIAGSLDETCVHVFQFFVNLGNCHNQYKCELCGRIRDVDSSG